jgi:hypothetical protein
MSVESPTIQIHTPGGSLVRELSVTVLRPVPAERPVLDQRGAVRSEEVSRQMAATEPARIVHSETLESSE